MTTMRYRLNVPDVIEETVDGEVLVIHTTTGIYYSLVGTGQFLWNSLLAGHTSAEIGATFAEGEYSERAATTNAVERFAEELVMEQLIVPDDQRAAPELPVKSSQAFTTPALIKFTDMQELLLVDPIHEVDPREGWPRRPKAD